jgi:hypothetical protein
MEQLLIISLTIEIEKALIAKISIQSEKTFRYLPFKAQRSLYVPLDVTSRNSVFCPHGVCV